MTIFLKKNSTLPEIKYPLQQWMLEKLDITEDMLQDVAVTFSMIDANTGNYRIANREAKLVIVENIYERLDECKYTLAFRVKLKDTKKDGLFRGEFKLDFLGEDNCGKITLPTDDTIQIVIGDSITKTSVV
jgi:hypothetical protein